MPDHLPGAGLGVPVIATPPAVQSWVDTSSSTANIGVAVAIVLALPVLSSLALSRAGVVRNRRDPGAGSALVIVGAVIVGAMVALVALQLILGS